MLSLFKSCNKLRLKEVNSFKNVELARSAKTRLLRSSLLICSSLFQSLITFNPPLLPSAAKSACLTISNGSVLSEILI